MSTRHVPKTPIGPTNMSKKQTYAPLTPHTPLITLSPNMPNSESPHKSCNTTFNSLTPPGSVPRTQAYVSPTPYAHRRLPLASRPLTLENWRNTSDKSVEESASNCTSGETGRCNAFSEPLTLYSTGQSFRAPVSDLLPAAFISTKRRVRSAPVARPYVQNENSLQPHGLRHVSAQNWNRSKLRSIRVCSDAESPPDSESSFTEAIPKGDGAGFLAPTEIYSQNLDFTENAPIKNDLQLDDTTKCVACTTSRADLVTLSCDHVMCSSCFTASLNIVGEKTFSCAKCLKPVEHFAFTKPSGTVAFGHSSQHRSSSNSSVLFSNDASPSARRSPSAADEMGLAVLRLDDVPWDVTPNMLSDWSGVPAARAHVLLNHEGKTLSHAYIEVPSKSVHEILLKCRNRVLGSGKRARKVTITFSSQAELMGSLFPSWMGEFHGVQPTVANLDPKHLPIAINQGILTAKDLEIFRRRAFHPDSRYVKDPSLPFFVIVSVINKFPSNGDSRIFWNFSTRDILFNLALTSIIHLSKRSDVWSNGVVTALAGAILTCPIFTKQQVSQVHEFFEPMHSSSESSFISTPAYSEHREPSPMIYNPPNGQYYWSPYDTIARDLGLEPHVVQAVCQRLTQTHI